MIRTHRVLIHLKINAKTEKFSKKSSKGCDILRKNPTIWVKEGSGPYGR